jgi:hypothetical protein
MVLFSFGRGLQSLHKFTLTCFFKGPNLRLSMCSLNLRIRFVADFILLFGACNGCFDFTVGEGFCKPELVV